MPFHDVPKIAIRALIRAYAYVISPLMGQKCRFYPSCSDYTAEAVDRHGALKGIFMGLKRILKCHPWHKGQMIDPVPTGIDWASILGYKRAKAKAPPVCGCTNHQTKE